MEKYKRHADASTNINAFLPSMSAYLASLSSTAIGGGLNANGFGTEWYFSSWTGFSPIWFFVTMIPALLRTIVFLIMMLLMEVVLLIDDIMVTLSIAWIVRPVLLTPWMWLASRIALKACGGWSVMVSGCPTKPSPVGTSAAAGGGSSSAGDWKWPAPAGHTIITNLQSSLDVLALYAASPSVPLTFAFPDVTGAARGSEAMIKVCKSPWAAMVMIMRSADPRPVTTESESTAAKTSAATSTATTLGYDLTARQRRCKKDQHALVFFPEGTTSNGKGLLKFCLFSTDDQGDNAGGKYKTVAVTGISYGAGGGSSAATAGSGSTGGQVNEWNMVLPLVNHGETISWTALPNVVFWKLVDSRWRCWTSWLPSFSRSGASRSTIDVVVMRPSAIGASLDPIPSPTGFSWPFVESLRQKLGTATSHMRLLASPCLLVGVGIEEKKAFLEHWEQPVGAVGTNTTTAQPTSPVAAPSTGAAAGGVVNRKPIATSSSMPSRRL